MTSARASHDPSLRRHRIAAALLLTTLTLAGLAASAVALAADTPTTNMTRAGGRETALHRIQRMVAQLNQQAATPEGEDAVVARLSAQLRTPPETLRAQHSEWGLGYGELSMAYGFARASRKPDVTPEKVVTMRRDGQSWETIAKNLGVKVDAVATRMKRQVGPKAAAKSK